MLSYACTACLAVFSAPAAVQEAKVGSLEIIEAGIYNRRVVSTKRDASGVVQNLVSNPGLLQATTRVPARIGVSFGFRYKVTGTPPGKTITVRKETHYPAPGALLPGAKSRLTVNSHQSTVRLDTVQFSGYMIAEPWERMPGKWVFSFWLGDRKLGEQEFTLVAD